MYVDSCNSLVGHSGMDTCIVVKNCTYTVSELTCANIMCNQKKLVFLFPLQN